MTARGRDSRNRGIWKYGPAWARPLCAAAPWLCVCALFFTFVVASVRFARVPGVPFELPAAGDAEAENADAVVVLAAVPGADSANRTIAFFDDERFSLADAVQKNAVQKRLYRAVREEGMKSLLVMADARIPAQDVMAIAGMARKAGFERILAGAR